MGKDEEDKVVDEEEEKCKLEDGERQETRTARHFESKSSLPTIFYHYLNRFFSPQEHVSHFVVSQVEWTEGEIRLEV